MQMRVLSRRIEFMMVMRVFDRPHTQSLIAQVSDQFTQERRLSVIFTTDEMNTSHRHRSLFRKILQGRSRGCRGGDFVLMFDHLGNITDGPEASRTSQPFPFQ